MISKPVSVKALEGYAIHVCFADGLQGVVDLSHLAHEGIFKAWDANDLFRRVHINEYGAIAWDENLDICPDSLYLRLKGMSFDEWKHQSMDAYATN
ncbi:MAG: DUF2442 domain-containing protein [Tannerellaceae bacterium]|nr:DUF2442 domain-containing protein [Tannerellaceae bacterium]